MQAEEMVLLILRWASGRLAGLTRLHKVAFLLQQETGLGEGITFEPHHYGPFSKDIARAIRSLRERGEIAVAEGLHGKFIVLTESGKRRAEETEHRLDPELRETARIKAATYSRAPLTYLLAYIYTRYPDHANFSKIGDKVRRWAEIYRLRATEGVS